MVLLLHEYANPQLYVQVEMLLKVAAYGWLEYWSSKWDRFDFTIVIIMTIDAGLSLSSGQHNISALTFLRAQKLLRLLRLTRMVKAFKLMQGLNHLVQAVIKSLGAMAQVAALIFLVFFIYAYIGTLFFGKVKRGCVLHARLHVVFITGPVSVVGACDASSATVPV
jgi:hypothetical protein